MPGSTQSISVSPAPFLPWRRFPTQSVQKASLISGTAAPLSGTLDAVTAVREVCPAGDTYGPHRLKSLILYLTESGSATIRTDGGEYSHEPGSLVVVAPETEFTEQVGSSEPWQVRYLLLEGPWVSALTAKTTDFRPAPPSWHNVFGEILDETFRGEERDPWSLVSACAELLGNVGRASVTVTDRVPLAQSLLRKAERLLDDSPERFWSVTEMAAALRITPRQFVYHLKLVTGVSPATWMRRQKVIVARRLLESGATVTEAAERTGFTNPYHFSRVFKKETQTTPSEVRRRARDT